MLDFKIIEELKPNTKLLEIIKDCTYKTIREKIDFVKWLLFRETYEKY